MKFTAVFFLIVVNIFMSLVPVSIGYRKIEAMTAPAGLVRVNIDWKKLYPFDEPEVRRFADKKQTLVERFKGRFDSYTSKSLLGSHRLVEAARTYEEFIGWNIAAIGSYNPVVKIRDGYLTSFKESSDVSGNAESLKAFSEFCRENGTELFYINLPCKVCVSEDKDINGVLDYTNQNADRLLSMIGEAGITYYDLRKYLHEEGMNHHEAFFRTDHHWKPETGLWAAGHILRILRDDYGWPVDAEILNPERFRYENYSSWFLGSEGKKLTLARTSPDDFTMIYPEFSTQISFDVPYCGISAGGDFTVIYNMRQIKRKDYYNLNPYGAYKYADQPLTHIHNKLNGLQKTILVVHDSMSNVIIPFIGLGIQDIYELDLRHFTGSLRRYILSLRPDMVIVSYYSSVTGRPDFYDFR